jgi:enolase
MAKIINITALEILDSRGIPAIEVTVYLDDGSLASASSATETYPPVNGLRDRKDNDEKHFKGYGQIQTLNLITNEIKPKIIGQEANDQREIDRILMHLDNTPTKEIIGANTLLSISIAVAKASSNSKKTPLY